MTNEELVELYQSGDNQALNELVEKNTGMVRKLANKFYTEKTNSIDIEDLQQEGFIGLMVAAKKYDFNNPKRAKFITYAVYWIHQKMNNFIRSKNTNDEVSINVPVSEKNDTELVDSIKDENNLYENVEDRIYNLQLRKELEDVMNSYNTLNEREILKLRYGWDNNKCMSREEVGQVFNVTGTKARNIEYRAMDKIRRTHWGVRKAEELYIEKVKGARYSIDKILDTINFGYKYLV